MIMSVNKMAIHGRILKHEVLSNCRGYRQIQECDGSFGVNYYPVTLAQLLRLLKTFELHGGWVLMSSACLSGPGAQRYDFYLR